MSAGNRNIHVEAIYYYFVDCWVNNDNFNNNNDNDNDNNNDDDDEDDK